MQSDPFTKDHELVDGLELGKGGMILHADDQNVPGQPLVPLAASDVQKFLEEELSTKRLDIMYPILWLVSSQHNISPLHHQTIKGREIIITERPDLHLVWYYNRIFIKPIPICLLNYVFFKYFICQDGQIDPEMQLATVGFLRTYSKLITHKSDFEIAQSTGLLPKGVLITWEQWCRFIQGFREIPDDHVTKRYHYGELRLTRLNFYSKITLRGWCYFDIYIQYGQYFSSFFSTYLFMFGSITLVLTAMQVGLAAGVPATHYHDLAYKFSNISIFATVLGLGLFPLLYLFFQVREFIHAMLHDRRH